MQTTSSLKLTSTAVDHHRFRGLELNGLKVKLLKVTRVQQLLRWTTVWPQ